MAGLSPGVAPSGGRCVEDSFNVETEGSTITDRFAASAKAAATSIAALQRAEALTYAELDRRSNRLARHLRSRGVVAGDLVALLAGRSIDLLVAILATLKLGAAYAPLDPAAPADYQGWMLRDCGARIVLAAGAPHDLPLSTLPLPTLALDEALSASEAEDDLLWNVSAAPMTLPM